LFVCVIKALVYFDVYCDEEMSLFVSQIFKVLIQSWKIIYALL